MAHARKTDTDSFVSLGDSLNRTMGTVIGFLDKGRRSPQERQAGEVLAAASAHPLLRDRAQADLQEAIQVGDLTLLELKHDALLFSPGRALLILEGQLALSAFADAVLRRERLAQDLFQRGEGNQTQWRHRYGPLIRLAQLHLGWFLPGDVLEPEVLTITLRERAPRDQLLALFTTMPTRVLSLSLVRASLWRCDMAFQQRYVQASQSAHQRALQSRGASAEVVDTFIRHGLSIANTLRVIDLERCTFCRECETACAARYGQPRMSVSGVSLGSLLFATACRTCAHQRCLSECKDDAIRFDQGRMEVIITPEKCTGCSLCANACPYGAITMHPAAALLPAALLKKRSPQHPRVASKCDHCKEQHQGQQACIAACTKGALLELAPAAILQQRPEALAAPGPPARSAVWLLVPLTLVLTAALIAPVAGHSSYDTALRLGILGSALLALSLLYTLFNRVLLRRPQGLLRWALGSLSTHGWSGALGALLILGHSSFSSGLSGWQGALALCAFWLLCAVSALGLGARYFASGIVGVAARARMLHRDVEEELARQRGLLTEPERLDTVLAPHRARFDAATTPAAALQTLLRDELTRPLRSAAFARELAWINDPQRRRLLAALLSRQVALWRHVTLLPRLTPLFSGLRWLHIPLAVLFALTALLHVGISLRQIGW